jgi:hypothetical protein
MKSAISSATYWKMGFINESGKYSVSLRISLSGKSFERELKGVWNE